MSFRLFRGTTLRQLLLLLLPLLVPFAWDAGGQDMRLARWFGSAHGFALRDHWLFTVVLHEGAKICAWAVGSWILLGVFYPLGTLKQLSHRRRTQLALSLLLGLGLVALIKRWSATDCPWDLLVFGGVAPFVSHWDWSTAPVAGTYGHCFPAGHASTGFAFVGGYFAFRESTPTLARAWLIAALVAGFTLGISQQIRGAHFMSHTLWTAWLCWAVACLIFSAQIDNKARTK